MFISGQVKRADLALGSGVRQLGVQEVDITSIVRPITKYAVTVMRPESIRYELEKAAAIACHGRPGPVWIDIPLDVQASTVDAPSLSGFDPRELDPTWDAAALPPQVARVLAMVSEAKRPVMLVGNGVRLAGGYEKLQRAIEALRMPVLIATSLGIDLVADDHPLFFGRPGPIAPRYANFTIQNCDLLLTIGARLDMAMTGYSHEKFARGARKIQVDIDPCELGKMRTPIDLPIQTDAAAFLDELCRQAESLELPDYSEWTARCIDWKRRYPVVLPEHRTADGLVSMYRLSEVLTHAATRDDLVVACSSGNAVELFHLVLGSKPGQRVIHTRGLGAMGFGLPAAIGACLAAGRRRTICLEGDGGLQLNIQELETLRRLDLPIKLFVINNDGYASIRLSQSGYFGRLCGADRSSGVTLPDLAQLVPAYGLAYRRLSNNPTVVHDVAEVLAVPGPVVAEVFVPPDEPRMPRMTSVQRPDGSMASKPLEDLWPLLDRDEFRANMIIEPLPD
jgi:acetolactate synthase-1/2/3 large subunit